MKNFKSVLPAYKKRSGVVEINGIFLDTMTKNDALRYTGNPPEMARRLLRGFIGKENLPKMCPLGNKNRPGIPEDIRKTVYCKFYSFLTFSYLTICI